MDFRIDEVTYLKTINEALDNNSKKLLKFNTSSVELSSLEQDTKESFDFIYKKDIEIHVSVRIRNLKYKSFNDLTIRTESRGGGYTEIDKIADGKADVYFYGYKSNEKGILDSWIIIDVDAIRAYIKKHGLEKIKMLSRRNFDGSRFIGISFNDLRIGIIDLCNININ